MKVPFIVYVDLESLLQKMGTCHNNPKKSSTTKITKHLASGYSLLTYCSVDATKSRLLSRNLVHKLDYYRGKDCMENFL